MEQVSAPTTLVTVEQYQRSEKIDHTHVTSSYIKINKAGIATSRQINLNDMTWLGSIFGPWTSPLGNTKPSAEPNGVNSITDGFPAPGLRETQRLVTSHDARGKGYFLTTDHGDHHRVMGEKQAVANILYSTRENPVDLNGDQDIEFAKRNEVRSS